LIRPVHFVVFAVDRTLGINANGTALDRLAVLNAMEGHVLASGEFVATIALTAPP
jgi:hypothetical protein